MLAVVAVLGLLAGIALSLWADRLLGRACRLQWPSGRPPDPLHPAAVPPCPRASAPTRATFRRSPSSLSWRHPVLGLAAAAVAVALYLHLGIGFWLVVTFVQCCLLLLVAVVDLEQRMIPGRLVYPSCGVAVVGSLASPTPGFWQAALLGGAASCALFGLVYVGGWLLARLLAPRYRLDSAAALFGLGDVRLGVLVGFTLGVPRLFDACILSVGLGGVAALAILAAALVRRTYRPFLRIPYGPFLVAGTLAVVLWEPGITRFLSR